MPTLADFKESKFLRKEDVIKPLLLTITGIHQENVAMQGQPVENKWCLSFSEFEKPFVCNSVNAQLIAAICGSDNTDGWMGKKIVLFFDPTIIFAGKVTGGIRARAPRTAGGQPPPVTAPAPATKALPVEPEPVNLGTDDDVPF